MLSTDKIACNILADLLVRHGVSRVVLSPGSRNAPLVVALSRRSELACISVVDERVAAFMALGQAVASGCPVAIVCTSGTALLNYAPAVAEAYYRRIPLIVVSADRPLQWIDQDDSQTLRQAGALAAFVKESYDIPSGIEVSADGRWLANRLINDALLTAMRQRRGPVHINMRLDAPLSCHTARYAEGSARTITELLPAAELATTRARSLGATIASPRRVMIVAGFDAPDSRLNRALGRLAALPNVAVLTETIANLHNPLFVSRIDATLIAASEPGCALPPPDVVITTGGALVSRHIKEYLRSLTAVEHWHVGFTHTTIDCFRHLTLKVEMEPAIFFSQLASAMQPHRTPCGYAAAWHDIAARAAARHDSRVAAAPWSDLRAFAAIIPRIPRRTNLHLSNGTPIRYAQLFDCRGIHRCDCNRGVSGIDGSTATAIGAAMDYDGGPTLLISGDMSAAYDIGALFAGHLPARFRMIVINNGGGGIFRFIASTSSLPETEQRIASPVPPVDWSQVACAAGLHFFSAASEEELITALPRFFGAPGASMLVVTTPAQSSAATLKNYFK